MYIFFYCTNGSAGRDAEEKIHFIARGQNQQPRPARYDEKTELNAFNWRLAVCRPSPSAPFLFTRARHLLESSVVVPPSDENNNKVVQLERLFFCILFMLVAIA